MKKYPESRKEPYHGFTLIELLVVIGIIGILASILIPVVGKVMTSSRRSESVSNLRQLHAACALFSNDHKMYLPNSFIAANEETGREQSGWWNQLVDGGYLGQGEGGNYPQNYPVLGSPIQRSEVPEITIDRDPPVYVTYGMNGVATMIGKDQTKGLKVSQIIAPGRTLFISEGHLKEGGTWFGVSVSPWGGQVPNHTDGISSFIYMDGHIGQLAEEEFPSELGKKGSDSWYFWRGYE